jgi:putrescine transport system substrate-binding protein
MSIATKVLLTTAAALALLLGPISEARGQGMISAKPAQTEEDIAQTELAWLKKIDAKQIATLQRLLRRLGYLTDAGMTRKLDLPTVQGIRDYLASAKLPAKGLNTDRLLRSLFGTIWTKEGWASGTVNGQDLVVEPTEVRAAQEALTKQGYAPGPVDGIYGPATFSAVEIFQEDMGLKVTGQLARNTVQNITRGGAFIGKKPRGVIRMLNWPDYIDPAMLAEFEKETRYRVIHEVFDSTDETKGLLLQGSSQYDVMVQAGFQMRLVLEGGKALQNLDRSRLPNAKYLDPVALRYTEVLDPGNAHSVPYMWGTVGIGVNEDMLKKVRPELKANSLSVFLDPEIAADVSKCGMAMVDEPNDVMPSLVAYLGGNISNIGISDLEATDQALSKVAKYITVVSPQHFIDEFAKGKYCVAIGYSGDVFQARDAAKEAKVGKITYYVPNEGSQLWFDLLVIPRNAKNIDGAYTLVDFLLKPQTAAANTNFVQYANPVVDSIKFIKPALLSDPGLYPSADILSRLAVLPPLTDNVEAEIQRIWAKLRKK